MNFLKKAISILMSAIVLVGVFAVGAVNVTEVRAAPIVYRGIDVSVHQGSIDFNKVKAAGYDFVIIRAGYGQVLSQKDTYFEQNYSRAKAAGLDVGVYWYSYASSIDAVRTEASVCLQAIKGKKFEYPIYFDLEEQSQFNRGSAFCNNLVTEFCGAIERAGYFAGLYMSCSPLTTYIYPSVAADYALWVAQYYNSCTYSGSYGMWQYSSTGRVNGINGNVDMNYCYVDYPSIIKKAGLNGYTASSGGTTDKTVNQLAEEVLDGKWGNGDERKQRLTDAGYNYTAVQNRVQELLDEAEKAVVTLSKTSLTLENGKSETITATVNPKNAANKNIKWTTSNKDVATVSEGKITAVGEGSAVITATAHTRTATCTVKVSPAKTVDQLAEEVLDGKWGDSDDRKKRLTDAGYDYNAVQKRVNELLAEAEKAVLTLSKTQLNLEKGKTETITATVNPMNAANKNIKWTTNNDNVATVSNGKITAVGVGTAVITATAHTKTATCTVTVKEPVPALVNNSSVSSTSITFGNSVTISGKASGGTSPYTYKFEAKHSTSSSYYVIKDFSSTATTSWLPGKTGTYTIRITVKDKAGKTAAKSFTITVKDTALTNSSTISSTSVNFGKSITLTGKASGGTSPYTYKFESKHSTSSSYHAIKDFSSTATTSWLPGKTGTYTVRITVKDKSGKTAAKSFTLTVKDATLTNSSTISSTSVNFGKSITLTGKASGGTSPYTYKFEAKHSTSSSYHVVKDFSSTATTSWQPGKTGTYTIRITVKDKSGKTAAKSFTITVKDAALTNSSTISSTSVNFGKSITLTGRASGGTSPYTYKFEAKHSTSSSYHVIKDFSSTATTSWQPGKTGTYTIRITVKDKTGETVAKSFTLTVKA